MKIEKTPQLIIDAAKNDDMSRVVELAEKHQDKFCDNNCVWTDHHPDCVRSEQKPVVEVRLVAGGKSLFLMLDASECFKDGDLLYTKPQPSQKPWVGLTSEDIYACDQRSNLPQHDITNADLQAFAYEIEAKLKEKNA